MQNENEVPETPEIDHQWIGRTSLVSSILFQSDDIEAVSNSMTGLSAMHRAMLKGNKEN